jgi:hypothetical protein
MPIADVELVMMALAAVLAAQHFLQEVDDCESLPAINRMWGAWKVAFHLAHLKWYGASQCGAQINTVNLILRLFLYHFLHTMSL